MKISYITPSSYAEKIIQEDFKIYVDKQHKTKWFNLSEDILNECLNNFNLENPQRNLKKFWD